LQKPEEGEATGCRICVVAWWIHKSHTRDCHRHLTWNRKLILCGQKWCRYKEVPV